MAFGIVMILFASTSAVHNNEKNESTILTIRVPVM